MDKNGPSECMHGRADESEDAPSGRRIAPRAGCLGEGAPPNKRMHATADTNLVIYFQRLGAARDARR